MSRLGILKDRAAMITGGASGIGLSTALLFAKEGANVSVVDIDQHGEEKIGRVAKSLRRKMTFVRADVTKLSELEHAAKMTAESHGRIDVLVNAAGIPSMGKITEIDEREWDRVLGVNLKGTFLSCKSVVPYMIRQKKGAIVNVSSGAALLPSPNLSAYCASKAGVILLTKVMALDYLSQSIRVNCVAPGPTDTPLFRNLKPDIGLVTQNRIGRRIASAEEIAKGILFLSSDDSASYITGVVLPIDGGGSVGFSRV